MQLCELRKTEAGLVSASGENWTPLYSSAHAVSCCECGAAMETAPPGDAWTLAQLGTYCQACFALVRPALEERSLSARDAALKQPRAISTLVAQVEAHRLYAGLARETRWAYEEARDARTKRGNRVVRALWSHLHHGTPL